MSEKALILSTKTTNNFSRESVACN